MDQTVDVVLVEEVFATVGAKQVGDGFQGEARAGQVAADGVGELVPVALGMDEDLLLALAVLDAQLVVATAARAAEALEDAAGLTQLAAGAEVSSW